MSHPAPGPWTWPFGEPTHPRLPQPPPCCPGVALCRGPDHRWRQAGGSRGPRALPGGSCPQSPHNTPYNHQSPPVPHGLRDTAPLAPPTYPEPFTPNQETPCSGQSSGVQGMRTPPTEWAQAHRGEVSGAGGMHRVTLQSQGRAGVRVPTAVIGDFSSNWLHPHNPCQPRLFTVEGACEPQRGQSAHWLVRRESQKTSWRRLNPR